MLQYFLNIFQGVVPKEARFEELRYYLAAIASHWCRARVTGLQPLHVVHIDHDLTFFLRGVAIMATQMQFGDGVVFATGS